MLNDLVAQSGGVSWKPLLTALLLPPVPLLLLMLLGAMLARRRAVWGWLLLLAGAAGIWLSCTTAVGHGLQRQLLHPYRALGQQDLQQLRTPRRDGAPTASAIVVLGAGRESYAAEYGAANLSPYSMERLRYGLWLARETDLPVAFSGGTGHGQAAGPAEAEVAAQIAARDFARPLTWTETESRDTRENAARSRGPAARGRGDAHRAGDPRLAHASAAHRAFEQAIARQRRRHCCWWPRRWAWRSDDSVGALRWLPSQRGFSDTRRALREYLGLLAGA